MTKFNFHNKKKGAAALTIAAFIILTAVLLFTACPNAAGGNSGSGSGTPSIDKTYNVDGVEFTMKVIAAVNNAQLGHNDYDDNKPHTVSLSAYLIGETEVTQELWEKVMDTNPSDFNGNSGKEPAEGETQGKRPVEKVNWYQAIAFCNKLSIKLGLEPCYTVTVSGNPINFETLSFDQIPTDENTDWNKTVLYMGADGFRLPTEAEWEWAAKGGKNDKWAGTNDKSQLVDYAWYNDEDGGSANEKTHEVKKKFPNGYGLYDMSGNVSEWCWDGWCESFPDPFPPDYYTSSYYRHIIRGGSWENYAGDTVHPLRVYTTPSTYMRFRGFRLVCRP